MSKTDLLDFFEKNRYSYTEHEHPPIFTVEQGLQLRLEMPGTHSKNLFLKDRADGYFLVSILQHKRLDIKAFCKQFGIAKVSFADEKSLSEILHLTPGSVTPFGLFYESARASRFMLDEDFLKAEFVNFHPLQNDSTISMQLDSFLQFFKDINHPIEVIKVPVLAELSSC